MSSWYMWSVLMKQAGIGGTSKRRHEIDTIRLMHTNSQTLPCSYLTVVYIFRLLMSFIGLLRVMGVDLLIAFNFYRASAKLQEVNLAESGW